MRVGLMDQKFGRHFGAADSFNAALFGVSVHPNVVKYIRGQQIDYGVFDQARDGLGDVLKSHVQGFMGEKHVEFIREATLGDKNAQAVSNDHLVFLSSLEDVQNAGRAMIPMIMANPEIHRLYHQGAIEGYPSFYTSHEKDVPGLGHENFMRATDGVLYDDGITHYYWESDKRALTFAEKAAVVLTWQKVLKLIDEDGQDPTSPDGTLLSPG